jgi:hypothetical protein
MGKQTDSFHALFVGSGSGDMLKRAKAEADVKPVEI